MSVKEASSEPYTALVVWTVSHKKQWKHVYLLCNSLSGQLFAVPVERVSLTPTNQTKYVSSISVISGNPESFTCVATNSKPAAKYQWYKGTSNITSADDSGVKIVTFDKPDNGADLKCRGWSHVTETPYPESSITINVLCKWRFQASC